MTWLHSSSTEIVKWLLILFWAVSYTMSNPIAPNMDPYYIGPTEETAGKYENAAVASSSKLCAEIGAKMLRKKGSAVDAAIATLLCDGVVSLQGMGIGGGFLMTIWSASEQKAYFLNAREYAPAAAHERMFTLKNADEAKYGAKSIAVPGEIAGYWEAHQKFGKLPWADLFEDTIRICEEGSIVSKYVNSDIQKVKEMLNQRSFDSLNMILHDSQNPTELVDEDDVIHRQKLAETLKKIRDHGKDIFYNGEVGEAIIKDIQAEGGIMTMDDLRNYEPQWKEPIRSTIGDKIMYTSATPGSGVILAFMMNIFDKIIPTAPNNNVMWQRIAETFKWAYARRNEIGDFIDRPEYEQKTSKADCKVNSKYVPDLEKKGYAFSKRKNGNWDKDCLMALAVKKLISKEYADQVINLIEDDKTYNDYMHYNITQQGRIDLGTAHTSVYAEDGSAVSVTSTINQVFGSFIRSKSTGIILNDEMDDYSYPGIVNGFGVEPSEFNFVRNSSSMLRPMSSMVPSIILNKDNTVRLVIGSAGGTKITSGVAQGIIFNLLKGYDIKTALDHPRLHHNLWPMKIQREDDFDPSVIEYLESIGHKRAKWLIMKNTLAAVAVNGPNDITASGDYRRQGGTGGY